MQYTSLKLTDLGPSYLWISSISQSPLSYVMAADPQSSHRQNNNSVIFVSWYLAQYPVYGYAGPVLSELTWADSVSYSLILVIPWFAGFIRASFQCIFLPSTSLLIGNMILIPSQFPWFILNPEFLKSDLSMYSYLHYLPCKVQSVNPCL
jgi:hypothetical protein